MPLRVPGTFAIRTAAALAACASLVLAVAPARAATKSFDGSVQGKALVFSVSDVDPQRVRSAHVSMKPNRGKLAGRSAGKLRRQIASKRVRQALRHDRPLRVRTSGIVGDGRLVVTVDRPAGESPKDESPKNESASASASAGDSDSAEGCTEFDPGFAIDVADCELLFSDTGTADPISLWGLASCAQADRYLQLPGTGDSHTTITGQPQGDAHYRRLTAFDGDDVWGERCELADNDHGRDGDRPGPTVLYDEGQRRLTAASFRLPENYPLESSTWQVVMQMKQTAPAANSGGTPVLALEARGGRWRLMQSTSVEASSNTQELWSAPAVRGAWTRFAFDIVYSQDPTKGSIVVQADLNGDGDAGDPGERSGRIGTYTLKREIPGGDPKDGIAPGESMPSHLRVGMYHNPALGCLPGVGCSVEVDNVQVVGVG